MRIRKNAKLSSLIYSQGSRPASVHVCQLNQSPWDVIHFAKKPYPASSSLRLRFEAEDSFNGNGSLGDSVGAVESVASMMEIEEKAIMKVEGMVIDDNDDNDELKIAEQFGFKRQFEEEEKEARQDAMPKSCNNSFDSGNIPSSLANKKAAENNIQITGSRRGRARSAKKGSSSSTANPYEFYYYSGFGPLWGKRRGGGGGGSDDRAAGDNIIEAKELENNSSAITTQNNTTPSSSSQIENNEEFYFVDDDDDDENDENGDSGKKRMRKPIKARSLKSLM